MNAPRERWLDTLAWLVAAAAAGVVLMLMLASLRWPVQHDLPIMLYDGWLVFGAGRAPYREIFEMNPPGSFLVYGLIDAITHGRDLPVRLLDLAGMLLLAGSTMLALKRHGARAGLIAACVFLLGYLMEGSGTSLQREYLLLLPLAWSLYLVLEAPVRHSWRHQFLLGLLAAVVISVKPSLGLGWLVLSAGLIARAWVARPEGAPRARIVLGSLASFALGAGLVGLAVFAFLARAGAVTDFAQVTREYWPLYVQLDGGARVMPLPIGTLWAATMLFGALAAIQHVPFTLAAGGGALGLGLHTTSRERVIEACVLGGALFAVALHVPLGNKHWGYHYLPTRYVVALFAGLCFSAQLRDAARRSAMALLVPIALLACGMPTSGWRSLVMAANAQNGVEPVKEGDVDAIEHYLRPHLRPGDRVLPLDVTGGAVHAMYRTHALLAGRFLYDFHFYHHVSSPIIQRLRREMADLLEQQPPRFVVQFAKPWRPSGPDCAANFPALDSALARDYRVALGSERFRILERREN